MLKLSASYYYIKMYPAIKLVILKITGYNNNDGDILSQIMKICDNQPENCEFIKFIDIVRREI